MANLSKGPLRFLPPLFWMGIIFWFSSQQKVAVSHNYVVSFVFFKSLHIIEYGTLFILWHFALYGKRLGTKTAVIIAIIYGVSDEIHQRFVPTREGRMRDVFIDTLGILMVWLFLLARIETVIKKYKYLRCFVPL